MKKYLLLVITCLCLMAIGCKTNSTSDNNPDENIKETIIDSIDNKENVTDGDKKYEDSSDGGNDTETETNTDLIDNNNQNTMTDDNQSQTEANTEPADNNQDTVIDNNHNQNEDNEVTYDEEVIDCIKKTYRTEKQLDSKEDVVIKHILGVYGSESNIYAAIIEDDCIEIAECEKYYYTIASKNYYNSSFRTNTMHNGEVVVYEFEYLPEIISIYNENKYYTIWDACILGIIDSDECYTIQNDFKKFIQLIPEDETYYPQISDELREDYQTIQEMYCNYYHSHNLLLSTVPDNVRIKHYFGRYGENDDIYVAVIIGDKEPAIDAAVYQSSYKVSVECSDELDNVYEKSYCFYYLREIISVYNDDKRYTLWDACLEGILSCSDLNDIYNKYRELLLMPRQQGIKLEVEESIAQIIKDVYSNYTFSNANIASCLPENVVIKAYYGAYGENNDVHVAIIYNDMMHSWIDDYYWMKLQTQDANGSTVTNNYVFWCLPETISVYYNNSFYRLDDAMKAGLLSSIDLNMIEFVNFVTWLDNIW